MRDDTINASVDTVSHRDSSKVAAAISGWAAERWPGASIANLRAPTGSGASSELFLLDILGLDENRDSGTPAVLRLSSEWPVYPTSDLETQRECMSAARRGGLPVPAVLAVELDGIEGLPVPFMLMECLAGRPAPDFPSYVLEGWMHDLPASRQERLWYNGADMIAALHAVELAPEEKARCRLPTPGDTALDRMLSYWRLYLRHVEFNGDYPELSQSVAWLCDNRPDNSFDEGLVWGDASLRNMLFQDLGVSAMLDFEFAHCGVLVFDIAFYAMMDHIMATGFANGAPRLAGFPGVRETLDHYEAVSGRQVTDREYWLRSALTYSALSTTRVYQRLAAGGLVSQKDIGDNPPIVMLRSILDGEPVPG